ncbi:hypothetical protein TNCV_2218121 [Trichonephila clavipes]|nr:hypothetical protein TNCV_2218121 [Trichonephila clavipes]
MTTAQDSALSLTALHVQQLLTSKNITVMEHPPYSPDLAPWLSRPPMRRAPQFEKRCTKGPSKSLVPELLSSMTAHNAGVDAEGDYCESDNVRKN